MYDSNAMNVPSGDHVGAPSYSGVAVSCVISAEAKSKRYKSQYPSRLDANAIFSPSGLGDGEMSSQSPEVMRVRGSLSGLYAKRWAYPSSSNEKMTISSAFFGRTGINSSVA